jgi:uncharacterized hydrophobic protein (TIGR00271 family)
MNETIEINEARLQEIQAARTEIARNAQLDKSFLIMNALAAIIASYGLLSDSASGVIGAMLVAMLLNPIAGVSLSLVDGDSMLFRQSMLSLVCGVGVVILCALPIGLLHTDILATKEMLARTHPNYLDLMIALAGGAVGAYAVITPRIANAVVGVAIATALVPPLCTATLFAARGEWENASGAFLLAFANIVAIQFASTIVLWLAGFHRCIDRLYQNKKIVSLNVVSFLLLGLLFAVLSINTKLLVSQAVFEANIRKVLREGIKQYPGAQIGEIDIDQREGKNLVRLLVHSPYNLSAENVGKLEAELPAAPNQLPIELRLRHFRVDVMTKQGVVYDATLPESALDK